MSLIDRPFGCPVDAPIELHLPLLPPSANEMWARTKKGYRHSDKYKAWMNDCTPIANAQRRGRHIAGAYRLTLVVTRPQDKRRRDLDNFIKPSSDLLVRLGVVSDDSLCESVLAYWRIMGAGVTMQIQSFAGGTV